MVDYGCIRQLKPKERLFFMYSVGIRKAFNNAMWARSNWVTELDFFVAQPINYIEAVPFVIVSKGDFHKLRDPHIIENQWKEITFETLDNMHQEYLKKTEGERLQR